jgi:hypothetical protein
MLIVLPHAPEDVPEAPTSEQVSLGVRVLIEVPAFFISHLYYLWNKDS